MDLADIRKKARTQKAGLPGDSSPQGDGELGGINRALLPVPQDEHGQFWDEFGTERFATEEEYTQGLMLAEKEESGEQVQWLGFYLGDEEYALDLEVISELIKPRAMTELPQVPDYVCGIISLRGEVIPVIDLKRRLGLVAGQIDGSLQRILICEGQDQRIGLLVDRVSQVVRLSRDDIETPQLGGDEQAAAFIQGIGRRQGKMLIQLRPENAIHIEATDAPGSRGSRQ